MQSERHSGPASAATTSEHDHASTAMGDLPTDHSGSIEIDTGSLPIGDAEYADRNRDTTERMKHMAGDVRHRAGEELQSRISDQKVRAADSLGSVAQSLRAASQHVEGDGLSQYMVQAANQVDNLASFLNNREISDLFQEVEDFARRQPAVFVGGAFVLGVLGARFLKSSRRNLVDVEFYPQTSSEGREEQGYIDPSRDERSRPTSGYSPSQQGTDPKYRAPGS